MGPRTTQSSFHFSPDMIKYREILRWVFTSFQPIWSDHNLIFMSESVRNALGWNTMCHKSHNSWIRRKKTSFYVTWKTIFQPVKCCSNDLNFPWIYSPIDFKHSIPVAGISKIRCFWVSVGLFKNWSSDFFLKKKSYFAKKWRFWSTKPKLSIIHLHAVVK